jgi:hypothetical protein
MSRLVKKMNNNITDEKNIYLFTKPDHLQRD